ncbi:hypothetical protein pEaSNUABM37_00137 [Erwinia phage pEa_SNUABM_37]|nr:hypothetical protein pEaSNUABM37_00137 [Erwinia phage pEa_SNUABM_37]QXO10607.1 hypothetical protein pEaSNUABM48_00137 [Erwinia phage pEa_SNUABM_48]
MKTSEVIVVAAVAVILIKLDAYHNPFGRTAKILKKLSFKKNK